MHPSIPWKIIAAMSDRLISGYDVVDDAVLWKTIVSDVSERLKNVKLVK
jgi:uncharacterized protein with HEPN domain